MKSANRHIILFLMVLVILGGCNSSDPAPENKAHQTLVDAAYVFKRQAGDIVGFLNQTDLNVDKSKMIYPVDLYKITYRTNYKGDSVNASAIVLLPDTKDPVTMFSFHHGTISDDASAPTNQKLSSGEIILASALSSLGSVVVFADYLGFGASSDLSHPYYVEEYTATTIVNALYAAKQLAENEGLKLTNHLYLAGYSQGGYVTMATHKYMEAHEIDYFELQASFPAAGGYDMKGFQQYYLGLETYDEPFYMAYVAHSFNESYDWNFDYQLIFNEPYASLIPQYFTGEYSGGAINEVMNDTVSVLITEAFQFHSDSSIFDQINEALVENSLTDWVPQKPMYLYHGDADVTVPYQNSVDVYNHFIRSGASEEIVTFTTLSEGTHYSGVLPYLEHLAAEYLKLESK